MHDDPAVRPRPLREFFRTVGPGLVSGASNDDPSAIVTYATAGAAFGLATLWSVPLLVPMMVATVYICGKIGMVSGRGLAGVLRAYYPRPLGLAIVLALGAANVLGAAADIGAVVAGLRLMLPLPPALLTIAVAAVILGLQVLAPYRVVTGTFKWLALALLGYVAAGVLASPPAAEVLRATVVPQFRADPGYLAILVGFAGTALSPYLFFWQSSQQVEEEIAKGRHDLHERKGATSGDLKVAGLDTIAGMLLAAVVVYFVILATGATLHPDGVRSIGSAADAARALEPIAGPLAPLLFAIGFVGAGLVAVPVLTTGAAYALAEVLDLRHGLDRKPWEAKRFYLAIALFTAIAAGINLSGVDPIRLLLLVARINGYLTPLVLLVALHMANSHKVMGARTNGRALNALGAFTVIATLAAAIASLVL